MAVQIRFNPTQPNIARSFSGKSVSVFTVTVAGAGGAVNLTDEFGPNGAFQAIMRAITAYTTPLLVGAVTGADVNTFDVYFEGDFGTDNWGAPDVQPFEEYLQGVIQGLGAAVAPRAADFATVVAGVETESVAGVDVTASTVVRGEVYQAEQTNEAGVPYVNA